MFEVDSRMASEDRASKRPQTLLLVANYDSDVGYAWWLMESYWATLAAHFTPDMSVLLAYPSISRVPNVVASSPAQLRVMDFGSARARDLWKQFIFLRVNRVYAMYLTDAPAISLRYAMYRIAGVRSVIVHDHTPGARSISLPGLLYIKRLLHRLSFFTADAMLGASAYVTRRHRKILGFPANRCFTVENGIVVEDPSETSDVRDLFSIPATRRVLVCAARAHPIKGISVLLEAMHILVREQGRTDVHLLHCGDGPALQDLVARAEELQISDYVTFAGRQGNIRSFLGSCDIGVHPSFAEVGYSLSTLEFMNAGLAVVTSDHESVSGAIEPEQTGVTFRTGDAISAASTIARLLDDPDFTSRLGAAGRAVSVSRFNIERTHSTLIRTVEQIIR